MRQLRRADLLSLAEFLGDCYATRDYDAFVSEIPKVAARLIKGDCCVFNYFDFGRHHVFSEWDCERPDEEILQRLVDFADEHPIIAHHKATGDPGVFKISDFVSKREWHERGLYRELFRHFGIEEQLSVGFAARPSYLIAIGHNRSVGVFSERDRTLLSLAAPHMLAAHRNAEVLTALLSKPTSAEGATRRGLLLVDETGRMLELADSTARCLAPYLGPIRFGRAPEKLWRWVENERCLRSESEVPAPSTPLVIEGEDACLVVRYINTLRCGETLLTYERALRVDPLEKCRALGLTRREAEVSLWVARGKTNKEIGTILGISPRTVQKHLEHVYSKLGMESRASVVRGVLEFLGEIPEG